MVHGRRSMATGRRNLAYKDALCTLPGATADDQTIRSPDGLLPCHRLFEELVGLVGSGFRRLRDDPRHLTGGDFFARYAAGLTGMRIHHGTGTAQDLARAAGGHQDEP